MMAVIDEIKKERKEVVSDLKTLAYKECKIAACKKFNFSANFALLAGFFGIGATIRIGREMVCLPCAGFFTYIILVLPSFQILNKLSATI